MRQIGWSRGAQSPNVGTHVRTIATLATIPLAVAAVYHQAADAYFLEDDFQWLVSAWHFRFSNLLDVNRYNEFYRPVIEIYFYIFARAFGRSPALFHWVSIALHALNGLVVYGLMQAASHDRRFAFFTALGFVVLPGYVDAVVWVGAIAEPLSTLFYCLTIWWFLRYLYTGGYIWYQASMLTFALALLTHESSVTLIAMMVLAEWAFGPPRQPPGTATLLRRFAAYAPYLILVAGYLAIDVPVNRRNYVVEDGYYRFGFHAVQNIFNYLVSLYVGKKVLASYIAIGVTVVLVLLRGSRRVRFATLWMLSTLLPFAFFTWGNTSRYLYLPAVGFSMLLGDAVLVVDRRVASRLAPRWRPILVIVIFLVTAIRFAVFTTKGVDDFMRRTEAYREYIEAFRTAHPQLKPRAVVRVPAPTDRRLQVMYLEPLVQWEYGDPGISLLVEPGS